MAYVVARSGRWELRRSQATEKGPRSRTLATFRTLDAEVIERAVERSGGGLTAVEILRAARRAGAPVEPDAATGAAACLMRELDAGRGPSGGVRRALLQALGEDGALSAAERSAALWLGRGDDERGLALHDLLLLADALPPPRRERAAIGSVFPRLDTRPA